MSILIQGMEMPKGNSTINVLIYADGTVYTGHVNDSRYSAVSVPTPHGRLIDADKLKSRIVLDEDASELKKISADIRKWIDIQETVIEAEGET